ncbi:hypothetical protein [Streptomyces tubercidicus]|uniref:hypothetical protein n=1 Tax=Streptomyces tubercidicus TaxID=47759 RepID=UPI002E0EA682|nr:hypothetical protein OG761_17070 [Streptomyces tubercidicus]
MIRNRIAAAAAVAALAVASIGLAAPANASPVKASAKCSLDTVKAKETLRIRKSPKTSSPAVALFPKGKMGCYQGDVEGQKYKRCGKTYDMWTEVTYRGNRGYVPQACTSW